MEGAARWLATGPENQGDRKVRGSIPPPSANPERASRQAHCDRLLTGSSPRVSVSNTGRSANPILSMAGNVFGKDATVVRFDQGAPVIGGSVSRGARQSGCNPAARSGALFGSAFPHHRVRWRRGDEEFSRAMTRRADKGLFVTTGTFSPAAVKEATRDGAPPSHRAVETATL